MPAIGLRRRKPSPSQLPSRAAAKMSRASSVAVMTIRTERLRLVPVTTENAGILWDVLQEPDLRDFQDLPNVNCEQFLRAVGARPTRFAPGIVGRFEWLLHFLEGESE